jgi:bifunctional DNA-binding transcriptional regulator/antitoxin component of YhaV-PrlF toxin-antitoxin module
MRKSTCKFYIDRDGAGRIYVPKNLTGDLSFSNGEQLKITLDDEGKLIIEKL